MSIAGAVDWPTLSTAEDHEPIVHFDGRLDHRSDLARTLGLPSSASPAALIADGFRQQGSEIFDRLSGDYAIAVIEPARSRLHLVRDPTGQRPLLFTTGPTGVRFGSTPRELGIALRPDLVGLTGIVGGQMVSQRATALADIDQVRPGEHATLTPAGRSFRSWWQPVAEPEPFDPARDYVEEYRSLLADGVARRTGPGGVATHLSGGWDSSAVTSAAVALLGPVRVAAYTAVPWQPVAGALMRHSNPDERDLAGETAAMLGIRHRLLGGHVSPFETARWFTQAAQAPVIDPFQLGWWHAARDAARTDGATTLLSGETGNLSLNASGLPMLRWLLRQHRLGTAWEETRRLVAAGTIRWRGAVATAFAAHLPVAAMTLARRHFAGGAPPLDASFVRPEYRRSNENVPATGNPHADRLAMLRDSDHGIHRHLAERDWQLAEADPTADRRLVEWSLRLPVEALLHHGVLRPMARAALQGRVPTAVLQSSRRGLQSADWYQHVSAADCRAVLGEIRDTSLVREFLDIAALDAALAHWPSGDWNSLENYGRYRVGAVGALCAGLFIAQFAP